MYLFLGFNGEIACKNSFDFQCIEISSIFVREKVCFGGTKATVLINRPANLGR